MPRGMPVGALPLFGILCPTCQGDELISTKCRPRDTPSSLGRFGQEDPSSLSHRRIMSDVDYDLRYLCDQLFLASSR